MSRHININNLPDIAVGLNIEGYKPTLHLPKHCKWYNIVQVIDEPLQGTNFDDIMEIVTRCKYDYIEQAANINIENFLNQLETFVNSIAKNHKNVLIHVHQYTGTTILAKTLQERTSIKTILDETNFFDHPVHYDESYPEIDALISISQCAGFGKKAGQWIIPTSYMEFDVHKNIIYTQKIVVDNGAKEHFPFDHVEGNILIVNDLWNPDINNYNDILLKEDSNIELSCILPNDLPDDLSN